LPGFAVNVWAVTDNVEKASGLTVEGYKLEAKGRELATRRNEPIGSEDGLWANGLFEWHVKLMAAAESLRELLLSDAEVKTIDDLRDASSSLRFCVDLISHKSNGHYPRSAKIITIVGPSDTHYTVMHLIWYDNYQRKLTGRSGIWLYGRVMSEDEYTFSAFLNDYTSCFHQFLNWLQQKSGAIREVSTNVYATADAVPLLVKAAALWRDAVERYFTWELYHTPDYRVTTALCHGNEAEFRVGSAVGHATHVERRVRITAEYYDTDEAVHRVFMALSSRYNCRVIEHEREERTVVVIPLVRIPEFFQGVLPFVTSMDFRLRYPSQYWYAFSEELRELQSEGLEGEDLEYELCLKAYERFIKPGE
jgi:hypothetical protein